MADETVQSTSSGYGKRPLWQWILLYVVIAAVVYGIVYYFVFAKKGSPYGSGYQYPTTTQQVMSPTVVPTAMTSTSPEVSQKITVTGTEFAFSPSSLTVKMGQPVTITFKNSGTFPHNFTLSDLNIKTATIEPGQTATVTFTPTKAGSFTYICSVPGHADRGMKGTLTVE